MKHLRVKIIEMLGSEGPAMGEHIFDRLPFPQGQIDSILHELEMRNVISVGFYKQTDDAEYILKVDEHRITGGEEDVVEYRWVQNLVMQKSFEQYQDGLQPLTSTYYSKNNKRCCTELMASDMLIGRICN